jgi:hypothetical protein
MPRPRLVTSLANWRATVRPILGGLGFLKRLPLAASITRLFRGLKRLRRRDMGLPLPDSGPTSTFGLPIPEAIFAFNAREEPWTIVETTMGVAPTIHSVTPLQWRFAGR